MYIAAERLLQRLEWTVLKRLDGQLQGDYRSLFRGAGLVFADLREYRSHDDVRHIDWNVTARMQTPYVRVHHEDREISAWFVVDVSPSMDFTSNQTSKRDLAIQIVTVLASLLAKRGNRVGALVYSAASPRADIVIPAGQGRRHVLQLLHRLQGAAPAASTNLKAKPQSTDLHHLLDQTAALCKRRASVFVISDFLSQSDEWKNSLARLSRRHDVLAVQIGDPAERQLPNVGMLVLQDAETGEKILLDGNDAGFRQRFEDMANARQAGIQEALSHGGSSHLSLMTDQALDTSLIQFARLRKQRRLAHA
jgi:uncharacterized protein (DUF58 family)